MLSVYPCDAGFCFLCCKYCNYLGAHSGQSQEGSQEGALVPRNSFFPKTKGAKIILIIYSQIKEGLSNYCNFSNFWKTNLALIHLDFSK